MSRSALSLRASSRRTRRQLFLEPLEDRRVMAVLINEFVLNHAGTDTHEFVEILTEPNADLSSLTLVQIDGDGAEAGVIDSVESLGIADANGIFRTPFYSNRFENGSVTLHVVSGFTGGVGLDIDTDNDGIRDVTPWALPSVDSIAILDGSDPNDRTFSAVLFTPGFGGNAFTTGGASRIPGIPDTNTTNDWLLNDFDGAGLPGFTGMVTPPEVFNTPGAPNGGGATTPVRFNEFVLNHVGTDTHEFVEIIAAPNTNLSHLSLLQIEGDGTAAGVIDSVESLGTTDANGIFRTPFYNNRFENGTVTLRIVEGFSGAVGLDIDTNNDGVRDATPWLTAIDAVAVNDGNDPTDRVYAAVVFFPGFGGNPFATGGASRIPGIPDTNTTNDWLLNDFDGAGLPGFAGTLTPPEVPNTPGAPNQAVVANEIKFDPTGFLVSEGNGGGFFENTVVTVRRTGEVSAAASVQVEVHPGISTPVTATGGNAPVAGVDYDNTVFPITIHFAPGQETAQVPIRLHADAEFEPTETLDLRLVPGSATGIAPIGVQDTAVLNIINDDSALTPIYVIQGIGTASPLVNQTVTTVGVVVADFQGSAGQNGFYIQDESGDGVVETSDGIFVFVPAANPLSSVNINVGDRVRIAGRVTEFNTLTELDFVTEITVLASGLSIAATPVTLPEAVNGQLERYEGMRISIPHAMTVQQNFFQGRFGQVTLASGGRLYQPTNEFDAGTPAAIALADENARRLLVLDDGSNGQNPNPIPFIGADNTLRAGDTVTNLVGVLDYGPINSNTSIRDYRLQATAAPTFARTNARTDEPALRGGNLKVSSFNVLNYFTTFGSRGASNAAEFERQSDKIVTAILAIDADILGLIEIENNGPVAIGELVSRLNAEAGAGTYAYINTGVIGGDEIAVGLIYKPAAVAPVGGPMVDLNSIHNRPPVAQTFRSLATGEKLTVVNNHFKSKSPGGEVDPRDFDQADGQGAFNYTRTQQAARLATFLEGVKTAAGDPDVLIVGDLNAYAKEDPIQVLESAGYVNQVERFDANAYSFIFDGQSGYLDHALVSASLAAGVQDVDLWHINADEPSVIDYQLEFKPQDLYADHAYRSSDHDPVVVSLFLPSSAAIPSAAGNVRFSTFNASLNRNFAGQLVDDLSHANNPANSAQALRVQQAKNVAEVIQRVRPDVLLINEFDFDPAAVDLWRDNFLEVGQNGALPIEYAYAYIAPSNTGVASGFDLNNNGQIVTTPGAFGYGDDALGFGNFEGQFGMLLLSKYEIVSDEVRTFQNFLWKDMPGNRLPDDPATPGPDDDFYSDAEKEIFRLSSKSHWDVPILVGGETIHVLASHPTPPVFDGAEDRNGRRNFDEIRLWADYVTPHAGDYLYDDDGQFGGIAPGAKFVIMGDQNSDPRDGDSIPGAIQQLLDNPRINTTVTPDSLGGPDATARQGGINNLHLSVPKFDTADFADGAPGNLRADYVLPSRHLRIVDAQVFWPRDEDPFFHLVGDFNPAIPGGFPTSDHRLVWVDVAAPSVRTTVSGTEFLGEVTFPTGTQFGGTTVGGLSGLAYDELASVYYAISDDRSQLNPARYYTLGIDLADGSLDAGDVSFTDVTTLLRPDGTPFPALSIDPEGIALTSAGTLFISSEGDVNANPQVNPFIREFTLGGLQGNSLPIPAYYLPTTGNQGIRNNLAFESLTITPDGRYLYTATENALKQDGPAATLDDESPSRILKYDLQTGEVVGEFVYSTDTVADQPVPAGSFATNGLVELLALDNNGTLLALERSFSTGVGNSVKLYQVFAQGALDVQGLGDLFSEDAGVSFEIDPPVRKELLLDLGDLGITLDNLEGLALGPQLADGRQSLLIVSDNNFSGTQFTQFLALALDLETTPLVDPVVETPRTLDDEDLPGPEELTGDADDPAIWVDPSDPSKSRVIATLKDGGLVVFDLAGNVVQKVQPGEFGNPRYNNVDLVYGFEIKQGGQKRQVDLAVVSDRENDTLAIYAIDTATGLLSDVTNANLKAPGFSIFGEDDGDATAYGLATYTSPISGKDFVFVSQASGNLVAQLELKALGNGKVTAQKVRELSVPVPDGEDLEDAQVEGLVADRELGWLYAGQEGFGIFKFHAEPGTPTTPVLIESIDDGVLLPDLEGLTIYYAGGGTGYLLASSQGDSTYATFAREGNNAYLGSFGIGDTATIDQANESDGADVINVPLGPDFPFGLLVVQDGANDPQVAIEDDEELENTSTNFKFVPWEHVAMAFPVPLTIDTESYDPRDPTPNSLVNGVAAGDTTTDSTVLWARSTQPGKVRFQVYKNPDFTQLAKQKDATVTDPHQPVKVLIEGLQPGTQYYYRATDAVGDVATGRFRTSNPDTTYGGLRFGVSGDWRGELAPYSAVTNADDANLEFFVALGDTVYADVPSPDLPQDQALSLTDYRIKNAEVYGTRHGQNTLADLRASTSILATIDDHEVTNDFAGGAPIGSDPRFGGNPADLINDSDLYNNGLAAFQEYNPVADQFYGTTGDPRTAGERKLYRANQYGLDAAAFVLDARSFRDEELPGANPLDPASVTSFLVNSFNPARTMLGEVQIADLKADLLAAQEAGVTWKFVFVPEPIQNLGVVAAGDRFEGYAAERTEILKFINDNDIGNVVFVAADIHGTLVNNLTYQDFPGGPQIATSAFEITTGAVAYDQPFGQTVVQLAAGLGLLTPAQLAFYDSLPISGDADSVPNDKDDFLKGLVNGQLAPLGYDPVGLNANLPVASGLIDATLVQGDYVATHTYGWTDFQIDPETQELRVITYGIEEYTADELVADPDAVTSRVPVVVSEFVVRPALGARAGLLGDTLVIHGDGGDNQIEVTEAHGVVRVSIDGAVVREVLKSDVEKIEVLAGDGGDSIVVADSVSIAAWLYGEDGDDTIVGGKKNNLILGGAGDDTIVGGKGLDVLIGGLGEDVIVGEQGSDLLVSGTTDFDDDEATLAEILRRWSSPGSYHDRIDCVRELLTADAIHDDGAVDILLGGQGLDWLLSDDGDLTPDRHPGESTGA